jgi:hypothetical protein
MRNAGCITVDDGYGGLDAKGLGGADTDCSAESILAMPHSFNIEYFSPL